MKKQLKPALLSLTLIGILAGMGFISTVNASEAPNSMSVIAPGAISEETRSTLTQVKQKVAFAKNLQKEARQDPQDIIQALEGALAGVDKILESGSLDPKLKVSLEMVKSGIEELKANPASASADYSSVLKRLEPLTDNPGE